MFELLKDKIYLRYWLAIVISFLGDAITLTTILFLVGSNTKSVLMISLVMIAYLIPTVILGPIIGPFIDKISKRHTMVYSDFIRMILVLLMIPFQSNNSVLLFLICLVGVSRTFFEPARIAAIPHIVGPTRIPQGIALFQSTSAILRFLGPVAAGFLIAFQGITLIFIYDSISYLLSGLLILTFTFLDADKTTGIKKNNLTFFKSLVLSYKRMFNVPVVRSLSLILMPVMFSLGIFLTNYKGLMFETLNVTALEFGWLEAFLALGIVTGAMVGPNLIAKYNFVKMIKTSLVIVGVSCFTIYFIPPIYALGGVFLVLIWSMIIGFGESLLQVPTANILLTSIPEEIRGQGVALTNSLISGFYLVGSFTGGVLASFVGTLHTIMIAGVILIISVVVYQFFTSKKFTDNEVALEN